MLRVLRLPLLMLLLGGLLAACGTMAPSKAKAPSLAPQSIDTLSGVAFQPIVGSTAVLDGNFDPNVPMSIEIFSQDGSTYLGPSFSTSDGTITVVNDPNVKEQYQAIWNTKDSNVSDGTTVRVEVRLAGVATPQKAACTNGPSLLSGCLAYFDATLNSKQSETTEGPGSTGGQGGVVNLINGQRFQIKVHVDNGIKPVVSITSPSDGASFTTADSITFAGTAVDINDGDISSSIQWSSSIDGALGAGASITHTLSAGSNVVTASVTDSANLASSASITLAITSVRLAFTKTVLSGFSAPDAVAVGDFNGDGKPDLAVANSEGGTVSVLLNTTVKGATTPTFATAQTFAVGSAPISIAVGDFNGDGKLDLAVANNGSNSVSVLLGDGSGGFTPASYSPLSVGSHPTSLEVGDFNGDGYPDLVVTGWLHAKVWLNGGGNSGFGSPYIVQNLTYYLGFKNDYPGIASVAVGDFYGDGNVDLAINAPASGFLYVVRGNGSGKFQSTTVERYSDDNLAGPVVAADLDHSGLPDLAAANDNSNTVSVLLNNGKGGFPSRASYPVGASPSAVAVGDFNGDGNPDLAVANWGGHRVSVLLNNGNGTFQAQQRFNVGYGPDAVAVGDFNGDGKLDLAVASQGYDPNGSGQFDYWVTVLLQQ